MAMTYDAFLTRVIDDGLASVTRDERIVRHPERLQESKDGFEACRGKSPIELAQLLADARRAQNESRASREPIETYWGKVYYALQIEWVCNTISAAFHNEGKPTIVPPTARGMTNAARILGVTGHVKREEGERS